MAVRFGIKKERNDDRDRHTIFAKLPQAGPRFFLEVMFNFYKA